MDRDSFGGVKGIVWKALQFSWKKNWTAAPFLNERFAHYSF